MLRSPAQLSPAPKKRARRTDTPELSPPLSQVCNEGLSQPDGIATPHFGGFSQPDESHTSLARANSTAMRSIPAHAKQQNQPKVPRSCKSPPIFKNVYLGQETQDLPHPRAPTPIPGLYVTMFKEGQLLGSGSFNKVHRVQNRMDGREYAVKRSTTLLSKHQIITERMREAHAWAAVASASSPHPDIVTYVQSWVETPCGGDNSYFYIQTELCECTLREALHTEKAMTEATVYEVRNGQGGWPTCRTGPAGCQRDLGLLLSSRIGLIGPAWGCR